MPEKFVQIWYHPEIPYTGLDEQIDIQRFGKGIFYIDNFPSRINAEEGIKGQDKFEDVFRELYLKFSQNGGLDLQLCCIGISNEEREFVHEKFKNLCQKLNINLRNAN